MRIRPSARTECQLQCLHSFNGVQRVHALRQWRRLSDAALHRYAFNQLSVMIEESSGQTPYMVMGDVNTELSIKVILHKNWYKQKPFNRHSVSLYDFLYDDELVMCNTK